MRMPDFVKKLVITIVSIGSGAWFLLIAIIILIVVSLIVTDDLNKLPWLLIFLITIPIRIFNTKKAIEQQYQKKKDEQVNRSNPTDFASTSIENTMAAPVITSPNVCSCVLGVGSTFQVIASGTPEPTFSLNGQSTGVSIDSTTGLITIANTTARGVHKFTITAINGNGIVYTQNFTLTVKEG